MDDKKIAPIPIDFEQLKARPQSRRRSPDLVTAYMNSTHVEAMFSDIKLIFGHIIEATTEELLTEDRIIIIMSPEHAKATLRALEVSVGRYEATFGPIRDVPGMTQGE